MNVLIIEDQEDFIARVRDACKSTGDVALLSPDDVNLKADFDATGPIDDQLVARAQEIRKAHAIDIVMLDHDLSRAKGQLLPQGEYKNAFHASGIPVCRYKKGQSTTPLAVMKLLSRVADDGASAVWIPPEQLDDELADTLVPWLKHVHGGFAELKATCNAKQKEVLKPGGPANALAVLLERPDLKADLLGYTAQNLFFFATHDGASPGYSLQLGYWLLNYVLAFPGPFHGIEPFYWRELLGALLDKAGGDISGLPELKDSKLERVASAEDGHAYYCIVTKKPIPASKAAPSPDWIPAGALMSRIDSDKMDQLGPMLNM
jgi:hypothetical protein